MKNEWFLHFKKWNEAQTSKNGTEIFVVCPAISISIELECSVGYGSNFETLEAVTPTALKEAKKVAEGFEKSPVIGNSVTQKIVGKRFYLNKI